MRREGAKRCENTTKPSPLPFPWLSQLRRLLGLCYWKTEERGTTGCNWGGGVPSLWGLAHPPRLLTWAGKGTKLSQPCLRFISPGKSLRCWLGWGWGGAGTQEPWNNASMMGSRGGKREGTSRQWGRDRVRKPATGEICGTALDRIRADFAGLRDTAILLLGTRQYGLFHPGEMGRSWKQAGKCLG